MEDLHEEKVFTQEELDAKKDEMMSFYKESMPYLKAQFEYEEMLMKIDEVRFKRTNIQMQFAMMAQAQQESEDDDLEKEEYPHPTPDEVTGKRKLKRT